MTPVTIQDDISIAANTVVENVIASNTGAQRYIRAPYDSIGMLLIAQSASGLRFELVVDGDTVMDSSDANVSTVLNIPDNMVLSQFFCRVGGQMVLRVSNTTAGALSARYRITLREGQAAEFPGRMRTTIRGPISVAANAVVQLLTGLRFERPLRDTLLQVIATASAAGLLLEVFVNGQSVAPALPVKSSNRVPIVPYDVLIDDVEVAMDSLIELRVTNTTGGALSLFWETILQDQQY